MTVSPLSQPLRVAAIDLGASSGRVVVGTVGPGQLDLTEVHRFGNRAVDVAGRLRWDATRLYAQMLAGLRAASGAGAIDSIGIDSWAIDYGLVDSAGALMGQPVSHRDGRTDGVRERVVQQVGDDVLYGVTGLQSLPFSTLFQMLTEGERLDAAQTMLLLPDLLAFWLTGVQVAERTNASTTDMYDVGRADWATDLLAQVGIPTRLLPRLVDPGTRMGAVTDVVADNAGMAHGVPVVAVGSHDTASAVVAVPFEDPSRAAYICSGTWSLVGVELKKPVLTRTARVADFTNEGGVDGTVRFLRNVSGLWLLSEAIRTWQEQGQDVDLAELLREAGAVEPWRSVIDPEHSEFLPPGDMAARIVKQCGRTAQPIPQTRGEVARCIVDSLAAAYARTVSQLVELTTIDLDVIHIVGGGSMNELLCQATADATGTPVSAGPVEASAIGNVLVQARAMGADLPDLAAMRTLVRQTHPPQRYEPAQTWTTGANPRDGAPTRNVSCPRLTTSCR